MHAKKVHACMQKRSIHAEKVDACRCKIMEYNKTVGTNGDHLIKDEGVAVMYLQAAHATQLRQPAWCPYHHQWLVDFQCFSLHQHCIST